MKHVYHSNGYGPCPRFFQKNLLFSKTPNPQKVSSRNIKKLPRFASHSRPFSTSSRPPGIVRYEEAILGRLWGRCLVCLVCLLILVGVVRCLGVFCGIVLVCLLRLGCLRCLGVFVWDVKAVDRHAKFFSICLKTSNCLQPRGFQRPCSLDVWRDVFSFWCQVLRMVRVLDSFLWHFNIKLFFLSFFLPSAGVGCREQVKETLLQIFCETFPFCHLRVEWYS